MIKVTLPTGAVVEGDSVEEVQAIVDRLTTPPAEPERNWSDLLGPLASAPQAPEPQPEPERKAPVNGYPHKLSPGDKHAIKIGAREEQILRGAKMLAEMAEDHHLEIRSDEILDLIGESYSVIRSSLYSLTQKGLLRHGSHRRVWVITNKGWNSKLRVTLGIRKP